MPTVQPAVGEAAHIMVVDDDADLRRSLVELLEEQGYEVSCAANGEEALLALERARPPSAILLDLTMPIMDGRTFRRRQQADPRLARIPTVLISAAHASEEEVAALGAEAFLAKPFELAELNEALRRACRAAADAQPLRALRTPPPGADARAAGSRPGR